MDWPSVKSIRSWIQKFPATASAINNPRPGSSLSSRTPAIIKLVDRSLCENARLSILKGQPHCGYQEN